MGRLAHLWAHHRLALLGFVAATLLTLFFAGRMVVFSLYWADPAHRNQPVEGWMTPGYVAHSWHIDPGALGQALGIAPEPGRRRTLEQIAAERGIPPEALIAQVEALIAREKARPHE